ncbi:FAD-dependent oxidoreductase, partial [Pseudonocardia sp. ICBG601]|uniref:NAD(P)/FAD-dependent oxidoreductase n=1 Tax=Pseudonocardia sp. ICBG601 TaxID=2846759 RepID=UPI001CF700D1
MRAAAPAARPDQVLGGLHTPTDGLAKAARAVVALARRAESRGAVFRGSVRVTGIAQSGGRVTGVETADGETVPADIVVSCAGFWGRELGKLVGMRVPLLPLAHQYARTTQVEQLVGRNAEFVEARLPSCATRTPTSTTASTTIASASAPTPTARCRCRSPSCPRSATARSASAPSLDAALHRGGLRAAVGAEPAAAARSAALEDRARFNGVFSFTPDGGPLIGESPDVAGFWVAEAVWVTHSSGVARSVAQL